MNTLRIRSDWLAGRISVGDRVDLEIVGQIATIEAEMIDVSGYGGDPVSPVELGETFVTIAVSRVTAS